MTIDEAIETLHSFWAIPVKSPTLGQLEAIKLGIEALKDVRYVRQNSIAPMVELLPGETEK